MPYRDNRTPRHRDGRASRRGPIVIAVVVAVAAEIVIVCAATGFALKERDDHTNGTMSGIYIRPPFDQITIGSAQERPSVVSR